MIARKKKQTYTKRSERVRRNVKVGHLHKVKEQPHWFRVQYNRYEWWRGHEDNEMTAKQ